MYKRNNGLDDQAILQNQFTAYVKRAVRNRRIRFLQEERMDRQAEVSLTEIELYIFNPHDKITTFLEREALRQALQTIENKERYIIFARLIDGKSVAQIAQELRISYRAVTSILYRGKKKLRTLLEEGEWE